jgi:hypothetical protein
VTARCKLQTRPLCKSGLVVISPQFANASRFAQGLAHVRIDKNDYAWIRFDGTIVLKYADPRRSR